MPTALECPDIEFLDASLQAGSQKLLQQLQLQLNEQAVAALQRWYGAMPGGSPHPSAVSPRGGSAAEQVQRQLDGHAKWSTKREADWEGQVTSMMGLLQVHALHCSLLCMCWPIHDFSILKQQYMPAMHKASHK